MPKPLKLLNLIPVLVVFSTAVPVLCEQAEQKESASVPGGFYFPQSRDDYVGVFPVSRLSGYHVFRGGESGQTVGEISGSPFVFHSGPSYCGWFGVPGFGWFGCGIHPPVTARIDRGTTSIQLEVGMSRSEVLKSIGAPTRKVLLNQKEIWEYKSYSLLFESGGLKEIR